MLLATAAMLGIMDAYAATKSMRRQLVSMTLEQLRDLVEQELDGSEDRIILPEQPDAFTTVTESDISMTIKAVPGILFQSNGIPISPWHDIPLYANKAMGYVNFICEIPKNTAKKFEITRNVPGNPIMQDTNKDGSLREYQWPPIDVDPLGPRMMWNYGALPQTWEDPSHAEHDITIDGEHPMGDNDPIDAIELGADPMSVGKVAAVKILCVLALVDSGETDWKLIVVRVDNPLFSGINTLADLKKSPHYGEVAKIRDWLRYYKMPTKGTQNTFGFNDGEEQDEKYALEKVALTHELWANKTDWGHQNREL